MNGISKSLATSAKSVKTTTLAVIVAAQAILGALSAHMDDNPETVANWNHAVEMLLIAVGLFFAKDGDQTSERLGLVKRSAPDIEPAPVVPLVPNSSGAIIQNQLSNLGKVEVIKLRDENLRLTDEDRIEAIRTLQQVIERG
jgi:hypothetical protein